MRVLVSGGTGFVGKALCPRLASAGHEVIVLSRQSNPRLPTGVARAVRSLDGLEAGEFGGAVNLAGEPIGDGRWTDQRRRLLLDSRIAVTRSIVDWIGRAQGSPPVLVSASAVGYYGEQGEREITEDTVPTPGFTHDLCAAWEREAGRVVGLGARLCIARIGVVLERDGGALAKMLPAFRMGAGGRLGAGQHWFPWIHREDMAAILQWLLENPAASGAYNASAPNPVTNEAFTRALGRALGRPTMLPMPAVALKLLFGDMAELLLVSDRMLPRRLLEAGFRFRHPDLGRALQAIFHPTSA